MKYLLYNLILHLFAAPLLILYYGPLIGFRGKYSRSFAGKIGRITPGLIPQRLGKPRLWFHAVSVGEVVALSPLVKAVKSLRPDAAIIVSTGTETGQDKARDLISDADAFLYLPLDFPWFIKPVVERIEPDLFVLMETELWPNLINCLKSRGTIIALANGRISDRSFPRYRRLKRFFAPLLEKIDLLLMSSEVDADRIATMGALRDRVKVTGNTKFDAALGEIPEGDEHGMRTLLDIAEDEAVLVAGSTHPGENEMVLTAYEKLLKRFPNLILIIVPRHVEKTPQILALMRDRGMEAPFLRSTADEGERRNGRRVVVVDRTGELFRIYSLASVVFIGGSLVPRGGQNILEPAAWGKVVLFGPSMEDFREARDILVRCRAGVEVHGPADLALSAGAMLADARKADDLGSIGRNAVLAHKGSAGRSADLLMTLVREHRHVEATQRGISLLQGPSRNNRSPSSKE